MRRRHALRLHIAGAVANGQCAPSFLGRHVLHVVFVVKCFVVHPTLQDAVLCSAEAAWSARGDEGGF